MSHTFRFLGTPVDERTWRLDEDEAHHLTKVLRLTVGAQVEVTDGRGSWAAGTVADIRSKEVLVELSSVAQVDQAPAVRLSFAVGALKPGAVDDILPALAELGVDVIHVFQQEESAKSRTAPKVIERWQRILLAATKQCKRPWIPELREHASAAALVEALDREAREGRGRRLLLSGSGEATLPELLRAGPAGDVVVLAGGEKGLSLSEEQTLLKAGFTPARLGLYVLRAVTAAVAGAAVLSLYREELKAP